MKTVVLTYIHTEFYGTEEFRKSCAAVGFPVHNAWDPSLYNGTVGDIMYMLYKGLLDLKEQGYTHVIYSDGADTCFLRRFMVPNYLLISAEKACFPDPDLAKEYPEYPTPWRYVNAGNWCGPIDNCIDFFERYGLNTHQNEHINGQREWHKAFLQSQKDKLKVFLDFDCLYMQSIAFADPDDFSIENGLIKNNITEEYPSVFHGNGRTEMDWIYNLNK
jgi:hypothetical protein